MSSEKIRKLGNRNFDGIKLSKLTKGNVPLRMSLQRNKREDAIITKRSLLRNEVK